MSLKLKKINRRMWIVNEAEERIHTPPNFIHLRSRADLENLMVDLEAGRPYIDAVMAWETLMRPTR